MNKLNKALVVMAMRELDEGSDFKAMLEAHPEHEGLEDKLMEAENKLRDIARVEFDAYSDLQTRELNIMIEAAFLLGHRNGVSLGQAGKAESAPTS
jgi:hypothetical protein